MRLRFDLNSHFHIASANMSSHTVTLQPLRLTETLFLTQWAFMEVFSDKNNTFIFLKKSMLNLVSIYCPQGTGRIEFTSCKRSREQIKPQENNIKHFKTR